MLIRRQVLEAIAAGEITQVFRRWKRPTVKTGGTLRTAVGVLAIDEVTRIARDDLDDAQAHAAGYESCRHLLADLDRRRTGDLYRIRLRLLGDDPRHALAERNDLDESDRAEIEGRLKRLDRASRRGSWTQAVLRAIAERPATRAADLAAAGGWEKAWFKRRVRSLKGLGLTESLGVGYRLSPRGRAFLRLSGFEIQ